MKKRMRAYWLGLALVVAAAGLGAGPGKALAQSATGGTTPAEAESPDGRKAAVGEGTPGIDRQAIIQIGKAAELKAEDSAEVVVVIGASAKVHGKVREAVVVIGGNVEVDGEVGDAVVAIFGDIHVKPGAKLGDNAVAVCGDVKVDERARIRGDVVAVGGSLSLASGATVKGHTQDVPFPFLRSLGDYFVQCVLKCRPMAPQVGWVWVFAGVFFLIYLLVAAAFPQPVSKCVSQLEQRPIATFLFGLLAKLLIPMVALILIFTGIGLLVVPFLGLAVFVGVVVGKVAILEWIGLRIGQQSGARFLQKPIPAFVLGALILTVFYNVWVVGLIAYVLFSVWGLGVAVTAVIGGLRRRTPAAAAPFSPPPYYAAAGVPAGFGPPPSGFGPPAPGEPPLAPNAAPPLPEAMFALRAGFWERMAAGFLDLILVGILTAISHHGVWTSLIALAYFTGLWTWRGTTVGGIVLGLKVVRLDAQPVTFTVALVRALGAAFSLIVMFLGFFWIAWDADKQGWHDKIAGTVVIRVPKSTPLVCA